MEPPSQLLELYGRWRQLTHHEAEAIEAGSWDRVEQVQLAKRDLQPHIIDAHQEWNLIPADCRPDKGEIRSCITELIELERRNGEFISLKQEAARREQSVLDKSQRNLRQIHRSYVTDHGARWNSYG